jgi:two-component system, chemotaxis family, chemotaxis protein CheY
MVSSKAARNKLRLSKINVLVVDDDKAISNLVKNVLNNLGFGMVIVVHNAQEGLDVLDKNPIDLVIADWEMSPMNGIEMTQKIRKMDSNKRFTPIIMLTGHGEKQEIELARDCGITEYLIKPFTAKSLCSRIMTVIDAPRSFVFTKTYKGPSRRRRNQDPPEGSERRKAKPKKQ